MAKFIYQETGLKVKDQPVIQPRFSRITPLDNNDFIRRVAHGNVHAEGVTRQVLTDIAAELSHALAQGCSVTLDGIGRFTPTLSMRQEHDVITVDEQGNEHRSNARSVQFGSVIFSPAKHLVSECQKLCHLERDGYRNDSSITTLRISPHERQQLLLSHLHQNQRITVKEYAALTRLSHTSASRELYVMSHSDCAILEKHGRSSHSFYTQKAETAEKVKQSEGEILA